MEKISIRNLRGSTLRARSQKGEWLAITNHRVLIGVLIPAAEGWVQHLIRHSWPQVRQNIDEAENAMAAGQPMTTIDDMAPAPVRPRMPLEAAIVGGAVTQAPLSEVTVGKLSAALNPPAPGAAEDDGTARYPVRTVRIGDLSARLIDDAGASRQVIAVTHDHELVGILIPVTQDLVQSLIEDNISRVLDGIEKSEAQLGSAARLVTLDEVIPPGDTRR
jgi:hypothetical protein